MEPEAFQDTTGGASVAAPLKDREGRSLLVAVLTWTFAVDARGRVERVRDAPPPRLADEHRGADPATSSLRRPSQLFDWKPGTDVVLLGSAWPPERGGAAFVEVALRVGPIDKTVRAFGPREWVWKGESAGGLAPGPAGALREPVPLVHELAWGGADRSDPERPLVEPRNPVGRGIARDPRRLVGQPAAQLEYPGRPLGAGDAAPAAFGPIPGHWQPRASFAGTRDEAWSETKAPLLPDDFDPRFHVAVPPDQWSPAPLRGDEPIEVRGCTAGGAWRFRLPRVAPGFSSFVGRLRREHRTHLDGILLDADAGRVELTWRAAIPLPRKHAMLDRVVVFEKTVV